MIPQGFESTTKPHKNIANLGTRSAGQSQAHTTMQVEMSGMKYT